MEASRNIFFSHFPTTSTLRKIDKGVDLGFFPNKGDNSTYGSTMTGASGALCKNHEGTVPSRYGKKVTKLTQIRHVGRLKRKVKFSWEMLSNVIFPSATLFLMTLTNSPDRNIEV